MLTLYHGCQKSQTVVKWYSAKALEELANITNGKDNHQDDKE